MSIPTTLYARDNGRCFMPPFLSNEGYSFYINFDQPISDPGFTNFRLGLVDANDEIIAFDIGELKQDFTYSNILYNIYCDFMFPLVPRGYYRLCIYDVSLGNHIKIRSNPIQVNTDIIKYTTFVHWRNQYNQDNYQFENLPNFYNRIRLPLFVIEEQYETDRKQYRNSTNSRQFRNIKQYTDKLLKIEAYWFDQPARDALSFITELDTVFFNNTLHTFKSGITINTNLMTVLNKCEFEAYETDVILDAFFIPFGYDIILYTGNHVYNPSLIYNGN